MNHRPLSKEKSPFEQALFIFNSTSAEEIIKIYHNGNICPLDEKFIEMLRKQTSLTEPVINVLLDYMMKTNNSILDDSFCRKIAYLLEYAHIQTAEEAMIFLRAYYHKSKNLR
ncbi:replication initiation and membrane attachment family protein [Massilibacterium senegalense]|uniref:DnaD domain protein n=1 Tax=Massilibacterium senegalense TaxID=1632858 RepID=UPI00078500D6|nr:DnaD domain protein [Massilibacterium senegalense]